MLLLSWLVVRVGVTAKCGVVDGMLMHMNGFDVVLIVEGVVKHVMVLMVGVVAAIVAAVFSLVTASVDVSVPVDWLLLRVVNVEDSLVLVMHYVVMMHGFVMIGHDVLVVFSVVDRLKVVLMVSIDDVIGVAGRVMDSVLMHVDGLDVVLVVVGVVECVMFAMIRVVLVGSLVIPFFAVIAIGLLFMMDRGSVRWDVMDQG